MPLKGRVALITGAASGIGEGAARLLAREGVKIGVLDLNQEEVDRCVTRIRRSGGEALGLAADVSDAQRVRESTQQLVDHYGRLDIVFANAGINGVWAPLDKLEPEDWDNTLDTNLKGTFLTVKYAVPHMRERGGAIVITSSVNGTRIFSNTGASAYSSSKAGQVAFAKMVALELTRDHIRVNVICPGAIKTHIDQSTEREDLEEAKIPVEFPEGSIPLTGGEPGTTEQVAQLVRFLVSDESSHITGSEIWIDGGESLLMG